MSVELVRTTTSDGHRLDGALLAASGDRHPGGIDACVLLHGVGSNFYSGNLFEFLAGKLSERGITALRVNTRGHDTISVSWISTGPVRQGAAYELVDHCRHDVSAWVRFLCDRGFSRIALLGHSLGAVKVIYSQAFESDAAVHAVIACSAPRLSHAAFTNSEAQPRFFESLATAKEHVKQGRPETLFQASFPFPILTTAGSYVDKYGPEERYNVLKFLDRITCPMLAIYGEREMESGGIPFAGMSEAVLSRRRTDQALDVVTIPGADHQYTGVYQPLADSVQKWLSAVEC